MQAIFFVFLLAFICSLASALPRERLITYETTSSTVQNRMPSIIRKEGCKINLCFALDGSGSIGEGASLFELQVDYALDFAQLLDGLQILGRLSAIQYGDGTQVISYLTFHGFKFARAMGRAKYWNAPRTDIGAGLRFCVNQLQTAKEEMNTIVLMTDGKWNAGHNPVPIANKFRRKGGQVWVVAIDFADDESLLNIVGGDSDKILELDTFTSSIYLRRLHALLKKRCNS